MPVGFIMKHGFNIISQQCSIIFVRFMSVCHLYTFRGLSQFTLASNGLFMQTGELLLVLICLLLVFNNMNDYYSETFIWK